MCAEPCFVDVDIQPRPYQVIIGPGQLDTLGDRLHEKTPAARTVVITDGNVGPLHGEQAMASLRAAGFEPTLVTVVPGEVSKSLETAARMYDEMAAAKIDRSCTIVALGGGVVGDLTGFIAATWMRGVGFVQCPTSLEADVDASVGGKTGVNHPSGKNLVGAFYQPQFVLIDTATLSTLDPRDFRAGSAESVKHAAIRDADFLTWHEQHADAIRNCVDEIRVELVARNVRIKAAVVAEDEREVTGVRALLNFGHTIGHAIETAMARRGDSWRHGEAVAAGMVAAAEMSVLSGRLPREDCERLIRVIDQLGLPNSAPLANARAEIHDLMRLDKKVAVGKLRFTLLDGMGNGQFCEKIDPVWIEAALDRVLV